MTSTNGVPTSQNEFRLLPIGSLRESPLNPRRHFDEKAIRELADSIRTHGILTPLLARPNANGYEIAAGHRRFRALQLDSEKRRDYGGYDFEAPLVGYMERLADRDMPGFLVGLSLVCFNSFDVDEIAKEYRIDVEAVGKTVADPLLADFKKRKAKAALSGAKKRKADKKAKKGAKSSTAEPPQTKSKKGKRTKASAAAENSSTIDRLRAAAGERESEEEFGDAQD